MDQGKQNLVIPIFIPHSGCPHTCAFCNQKAITGKRAALPGEEDIKETVDQYLLFQGKRTSVEIAFYGGNFLGLSHDTILSLLDTAAPYIREGLIHGVRFSTRPDTVTKETLSLIKPYRISAIELGVQSMTDTVLAQSQRGHTVRDTVRAIEQLRSLSCRIGVQVMTGLPGETGTSFVESIRYLAGLKPDFARIYPVLVLAGSLLARWYREGAYQPIPLEEAVCRVKAGYRIFTGAGIDVIRMGLQASDMMTDENILLAGPWHPAFGHLVLSDLMFDRACEKISASPDLNTSDILLLTVHPKSESRLRGDKNLNMKRLSETYPAHQFLIRTNDALSLDDIEVGLP